jgi:hypothetical protein
MELISQPETLEETVTDIDLIFSNGSNDTLTLRPADSWEIGSETIFITIASPAETITYFKRHIIGLRMRERVVKRPVKKEKA